MRAVDVKNRLRKLAQEAEEQKAPFSLDNTRESHHQATRRYDGLSRGANAAQNQTEQRLGHQTQRLYHSNYLSSKPS
jgi:hypothetical protein